MSTVWAVATAMVTIVIGYYLVKEHRRKRGIENNWELARMRLKKLRERANRNETLGALHRRILDRYGWDDDFSVIDRDYCERLGKMDTYRDRYGSAVGAERTIRNRE